MLAVMNIASAKSRKRQWLIRKKMTAMKISMV